MTLCSTLTSKNQTTIPKAVVAALKAKPSAKLAYELMEDGSVRLTAKTATFEDHLTSFPKKRPKKPVTVEMMNLAIQKEAAKHFMKSIP